MSFRTKLDYSDNRQIQQRPETITILSGATSFGVTFSALTTGPDLSTSAVTSFVTSVGSTFSGNSATTIYNWYDPIMALGYPTLTAITPSTSANTQFVSAYSANTTTVIDGNNITLNYIGVNYDITCSNIYDLGGGNYSGTAISLVVDFLSAEGLDFTGRTIWADVSGITRTENLIITNNAVSGAMWTCVDSEGRGSWVPVSAATYGIWVSGGGLNSAKLNGGGNIANGNYSVAEGQQTTASGNSSHAEGYLTIAIGQYSHAEGSRTTASGDSSHAEGGSSLSAVKGGTALGAASHAEGIVTTALGYASHAEGNTTIAIGPNSHTEGSRTTASGDSSHAEGVFSRALGGGSHAEGGYFDSVYSYYYTGGTALGRSSHAEGNGTLASGNSSHSEGVYSRALGYGSHAEGGYYDGVDYYSGGTASGVSSHAEGSQTTAGGEYSHAEGNSTIAIGDTSHAEGNGTTAIGVGSHAEGNGTTASGQSSHAEGNYAKAIGQYSHAEGQQTTASGNSSHAEGYYSKALGFASHAEGGYNNGAIYYIGGTASGRGSHAEGLETIASGDSSHAEGIRTTAGGEGSHAEGYLTTASNIQSHAEGEQTIASGAYSHAEGFQTTASGQSSHAEGSATIAGGYISHAEGYDTTASGSYSHAGGLSSTASGQTSFVHGSSSIAGGSNAIVLGANITGLTSDMTYVDKLNIKTIGAGPGTSIAVNGTGQVVYTTSDIRLKENVSTLTNALDKVKNLRGVTFQLKDRIAGGDEFRIGFIAQEVNQVVPELTFINNTIPEEYMGVHYDNVTALLVEAIKEITSGSTNITNDVLHTQTVVAEDNNIDLNFGGTQQTAIDGGIRVLHAKGVDLSADFILDIDGDWVTNNDLKPKQITIPLFTPNDSTDKNGSLGNITRDDDYIYIKCSDGWKRSNLESF